MKVLKELSDEYVITCYDPCILSQMDKRGIVSASTSRKIHRRQKVKSSSWKI